MRMTDTLALHVCFAGRSDDLDLAALGLRPDANCAPRWPATTIRPPPRSTST